MKKLACGVDRLEHKEYKRIRTDADVAVLFIHGIVGTPNHFTEFVSRVPQGMSVYNVLLDGHGYGAKEFSKTSMKRWESQISAVVEELSLSHKTIVVVAHSMGTLLAIEQAINNPKIAQLFLLAVPLKLSLKRTMFINSFKVYFNRIRPDDKAALAALRCCGVRHDKNPFKYIGWIPRLFELFAKIRQVRKSVSLLKITCSAYQSANDEMVSRRSADYLVKNPYITVNDLEKSGHYNYSAEDWKRLLCDFENWIKEINEKASQM